MLLFFDTETTGLPPRGAPIDHPGQPHLVQFAAILVDDAGAERACASMVIRPDGWSIPAEVAAIHGISDDVAGVCGLPLSAAVGMFHRMVQAARIVVAHNLDFDLAIMGAAHHRHVGGGDAGFLVVLGERERCCTMRLATPVLNLPPTPRMVAAGMDKPKPPKLAECVKHFFGEDLAGAHDALVDVRACRRVYEALRAHEAQLSAA